jgi:hypothetical protein
MFAAAKKLLKGTMNKVTGKKSPISSAANRRGSNAESIMSYDSTSTNKAYSSKSNASTSTNKAYSSKSNAESIAPNASGANRRGSNASTITNEANRRGSNAESITSNASRINNEAIGVTNDNNNDNNNILPIGPYVENWSSKPTLNTRRRAVGTSANLSKRIASGIAPEVTSIPSPKNPGYYRTGFGPNVNQPAIHYLGTKKHNRKIMELNAKKQTQETQERQKAELPKQMTPYEINTAAAAPPRAAAPPYKPFQIPKGHGVFNRKNRTRKTQRRI